MGFLSGGVANVMQRAFSAIYLDGQLINQTLTDNGKGGITSVQQPAIAIKYQPEKPTQAQRADPEFRATDIRVFVLGDNLGITDSSLLVLNGQTYRVAPGISQDSAKAYYDVRAVLR